MTWYLVAVAACVWLLACFVCAREEAREDRRRELIRRCNAQTWGKG